MGNKPTLTEEELRELGAETCRTVAAEFARGAELYDTEPVLTERQTVAYRLRHHAFHGLNSAEAAVAMGITEQAVVQLVARVLLVAPQLGPILTKTQAEIYGRFTDGGETQAQIAEALGCSISRVWNCLHLLKQQHPKLFPETKKETYEG